MFRKVLLTSILGIVMTIVGAVAEPTPEDRKTVSSKAYVDTAVATKQVKIPAAGQPNVGAGETVMTYTANGNGEIGERGLYSDTSSYNAATDADKLITASALNDTFTNLPTTDTTKLECANPGTCNLWTIVDQTAYGILPAGYTQLEYIESSGTQYINTGITPNQDTSVEMKAQLSASSGVRFFAAYAPGSYPPYYGVGFSVSGKWVNQTNITNQVTYENADTNLHTIYKNKTALYVDGTQINNSGSGDFASNYSLYLLAANLGGSAEFISAGKLYYTKIWDNTTLVRNFVPAQHGDDIGLYDTVSGQFFTNAATSGPDFIAGPAI